MVQSPDMSTFNMELPKGAGYQAIYGRTTLMVTQESTFVSITVTDREKGNILGRWTASADTIARAKRIAEDEAKRNLGEAIPAEPPEWISFDPPTPVLF